MSAKFEKIGSSNFMPFNMHHKNITKIVMDGKYEIVTIKEFSWTVLSKQFG